MESELMKQLGIFAFAVVALIAVWKFLKTTLDRMYGTLEAQNKASQDLLAKQTEVFAKALDRRDIQMDAVVSHLHESTVTLEAINDTTGRIELKVNTLAP